MYQVLSTEQTYLLEKNILNTYQMSVESLMNEAGQAAWNQMVNIYGAIPNNMCVFVGSGNNGCDALLLAFHAMHAGVLVDVVQVSPVKSTYLTNLYANHSHLNSVLTSEFKDTYDVIVDGVLGLGYIQKNDDIIDNWIKLFNDMHGYKVAIDIPSGIDANSGFSKQFCSVDLTITFFAPKIGHFFSVGKSAQKKLSVALRHYYQPLGYDVIRYVSLPSKPAYVHKYECGNVCVIGGSDGMEGAGFLSALAALRVGAGLSKYHYLSSNHISFDPSLMACNYKKENIPSYIQKHTVCVIGPGLNKYDAKLVLDQLIHKDLTLILDAGAFMVLPTSFDFNNRCVLTPHVGEAAKLLGVSNDYVISNPIDSALKLNKLFQTPIVLKSSSTVLVFNSEVSLVVDGCSLLATAGSGDVLTGIIAGYIARYGFTKQAIEQAVYKHAALCSYKKNKSLIASDLVKRL
ncbi:MAG: NAD(P)H-hydrate dehydratase [Gammaproteobacteria bacterium]|nr:NAD(P)H-hydrate dehydratase [Gammaproteobacteria bacterium]